MQTDAEDRKGIQLRDKEYFRRIMQSFKGAKIGLCKTDEGEYASGMLVIEYGKKCEMLYMGNDIELTKKTGSNAYLYDYMFHEARQSGCTYCDISGVEGDLKDGLAMQKSSYGAVVKEYIGEFDIPCKKTLYKLLMPIYRSRK